MYTPNPYLNTDPSPICGQATERQEASPLGATGDCPDEDALVKHLRERMEKLILENQQLAQENAIMKAEIENNKALQVGGVDQQEPTDVVTDEAARKRLERICKRRADGFLSFA